MIFCLFAHLSSAFLKTFLRKFLKISVHQVQLSYKRHSDKKSEYLQEFLKNFLNILVLLLLKVLSNQAPLPYTKKCLGLDRGVVSPFLRVSAPPWSTIRPSFLPPPHLSKIMRSRIGTNKSMLFNGKITRCNHRVTRKKYMVKQIRVK